jgi:hypothetical protein
LIATGHYVTGPRPELAGVRRSLVAETLRQPCVEVPREVASRLRSARSSMPDETSAPTHVGVAASVAGVIQLAPAGVSSASRSTWPHGGAAANERRRQDALRHGSAAPSARQPARRAIGSRVAQGVEASYRDGHESGRAALGEPSEFDPERLRRLPTSVSECSQV